ncbi:transcriptional regulator, AraC family [Gluconacetobacter diazotrophicus PA1 5]|uniref:AraC family transcriptional regulator n=2 Tax=Gluconacetobacter diazotrophicus TaxID=33996 RepID=A0A7W4FDL8_GLUDI|nr:AraC family transcriptional regulator [Gluconacetobacter diazotrophicus]ACI50561.1 transcriptional regulator, AraC family [Gluconacetobacter diazotrophicus PA1 5]MBB2155754.1 AraC family transcriptional regulator [Gluconacetobacter diazotrophicus]TWB09393.1 AraC-like DNA-binding protein [Gluconacetobacter diazotrophicus]CAP56472.1 putative transcriptional regulator, AraC family [Gluconacetobacter diazotrophicus PA1 5]
MRQSIEALRHHIDRHCKAGRVETVVPGLSLMRADAPTLPVSCVYQPTLCLIVQGSKQVVLGDRIFAYDARNYLIATVDLPVTGGVTQATPDYPYLALSLALDPSRIAALLLDVPAVLAETRPAAGLAVSTVTDTLLDPVARLVGLLDRPEDIPVLAPLFEQEILYRLLQGDQGGILRQVARADSYLSHVRRAVAWIRDHYAEPFSIGDLAAQTGMSASSFHRHFKAVTMMSPLQYRTRIRLQEARRMLLADGQDAAGIGFVVGYDSPSQFSREYRRMFGVPPARDAARLRRTDGEARGLAYPP